MRWCALAFALYAGSAAAEDRIPLNGASAEQLASLDGVGQDAAAAIVELRDRKGGLGNIEELRILESVDGSTLDALRRGTQLEVQLSLQSQGGATGAQDVLARFAHEPAVQDAHRWAERYANVQPELVQRWMRQSRSFALLPQVSLEYRAQDRFDQGFVYVNSDSVAPTAPGQETFALLRDGVTDQVSGYTVRARWDLDQLIMSSERIRVLHEAQDVVRLRDQVLAEVTRLYFDRRRAQVDVLLGDPRDVRAQVEGTLRVMELTAHLDALTGGAFSQALTSGP